MTGARRSARLWRAFLALLAAVALVGRAVPASATVGAGPWDVTLAYYEISCGGGCGSLTVDVRMTLDSDDTFNNYEVCFDANTDQNDFHALGATNFPTTSGTSREITWNGLASGRTNYVITDVFIVKTTTGCGTHTGPNNTYNGQAAVALPLRGRGGVTAVPSTNVTSCSPHNAQCTFANPLATGTTTTADPPAPTCSRTLSGTDTMAGTFTTTNGTLPTGVTSTGVSWGWGDGSAAGTASGTQPSGGKYVVQHVYTALSTMPSGGWKPLATVTYVTTGQFNNGTTTITKTCAIRADFLRPNITDPSSAGDPGGSGDTSPTTGDTTLDSCLPSGWNLLNPLAFVGALGCVLKVLFIPSSTTTSGLAALWGDLSGKAPFSVLVEVITFLPDQAHAIGNGLAGGSTADKWVCGPKLSPSQSIGGACDVDTQKITWAGDSGPSSNGAVARLRDGLTWLLGGLFVYATYRGLSEVLK